MEQEAQLGIVELTAHEQQEVSGGFLPAALLLFDVAIWAYDVYAYRKAM